LEWGEALKEDGAGPVRSVLAHLLRGRNIPGKRRCGPSLSTREDVGRGKAAERPLPTQTRRAGLSIQSSIYASSSGPSRGLEWQLDWVADQDVEVDDGLGEAKTYGVAFWTCR
jgi:hypothetical protein